MTVNTPPDVVKAFKRRKMFFNILWYLGCIVIAVGILSMRNPGTYTGMPENTEPYVMYTVGALLLAGAIYAWRCPVCGHLFWINTKVIDCSKCKAVFLPESKRPFW